MFFYFLKIIFEINTSKRSENIKKKFSNFVLKNLREHGFNHVSGLEGLFGIVIAVAVQSVFCLEMHQNNFFLLFKNNF
jgi:hypothetical protein